MDVVDYWDGFELDGCSSGSSSDMEPAEMLKSLLPLLPKAAVTPDNVFAMLTQFQAKQKPDYNLASSLASGVLYASASQ